MQTKAVRSHKIGYMLGEKPQREAQQVHVSRIGVDAKPVPAREKVLAFIIGYKRAHDGNSPTIREIMTDCKISSTSMVFFYLNQLTNLGMIRRPEPEIGTRNSAAIEVTGGKWVFSGGEHVDY